MPVAIHSLGDAATATVVWRRRGQLYVTVVIKGSFALIPEGDMMPVLPEPIANREQDDGSGMGLYTAGDLAPYLVRTDVMLTGHAHPPAGATRVVARLEVIRHGVPLLDKSVEIAVPEGAAAEPCGVRVVGMGPLSKEWPIRRKLLGGLNPGALEGPIVDIPESFDWSYFQAAPVDQRISALHGDEWLAFSGMHPAHPWYRTRLPGVHARAKLYELDPRLRSGWSIPLVADTLHLDVDRQLCTVSWRGCFVASSERELSAMRIVAGIELPGRPITWVDPFAAEDPLHLAPAHTDMQIKPRDRSDRTAVWMPTRESALPPPPSEQHVSSPEAFAKTVALEAFDSKDG